MLNVSFFGVRDSTPCPCDEKRRYGGNTSCVQLDAPGHDPIVLDLGTGLRQLGRTLPTDGSFQGSALVTHMHWDHVQGLPFFAPILAPGARLDVYGPPQEAGSLAEAFHQFVRPPFFPVTVEELYGHISFHDVSDGDVEIDGAKPRWQTQSSLMLRSWASCFAIMTAASTTAPGPHGSAPNSVSPHTDRWGSRP